jgi:ketosteroid isomerase-like protein
MQDKEHGLSLVRDWLDALMQEDWERFANALTPGIRFVMTAQNEEFTGTEAVLASYQDWRGIFSELRVEVVDGFACGDRVAVHMLWTGNTVKDSRPIRFPSCFLIRLAADKIAAITDFYDQLTYEAQLATPA